MQAAALVSMCSTMVSSVAARLGLAARLATDAADALALALCHLHQAPLLARIAAADAIGRRAAGGRGKRSRAAAEPSL